MSLEGALLFSGVAGLAVYLYTQKRDFLRDFFAGVESSTTVFTNTFNDDSFNATFKDLPPQPQASTLGFASASQPTNDFTPVIQTQSVYEIAREKAKQLLVAREGVRNDVYLDSLGKLTVGIGHLVLPQDNLKLGDRISAAQVNTFFENDIQTSLMSAIEQAYELNQGHNPDFIASLTSVNFQLGTGWTSKFPNTWAKLLRGDYDGAIANIKVSLWAKQTPKRTNDFINAIEGIG